VGQVAAGWSGVSGRVAVDGPPLPVLPAMYGVTPEFEPRGNESKRLPHVLYAGGTPRATKIDTG
jgi:hypothetical protein